MLAVIAQAFNIEGVVLVNPQSPRQTGETQIVMNREPADIEKIVVIRARTDQIVGSVRTVLWSTKRADMRRFRIRTGGPRA